MVTNLFLEKEKWELGITNFDFDRDVLVHFGNLQFIDQRKKLWEILCANNSGTPPNESQRVRVTVRDDLFCYSGAPGIASSS